MNFYFLCATQYSNLGDLVINKMLVEELCLHGKVFIDALHAPEKFKSILLEHPNAIDVTGQYGVSLKKNNLLQVCRLIKKNDIKLYTESPGPLGGAPSHISLLFRIIHFFVKRYGAHVVKIGNCCSLAQQKKQKISLNGVEHFYVRSEESVNYLNSQFDNIASYIPDLACLLRYRVKLPYTKKRKVAINLRCEPKEKDARLKECQTLIKLFANKGFQIIIYCQVKSDKEFAEQLYKNSSYIDNVSLEENQLCYGNLDFYSDISYVISNRLHSLLFGCMYNCIPIAYGIRNYKCTKIKHVFSNIFDNKHNIFIYNDIQQIPNVLVNEKELRDIVRLSIDQSAKECRSVIETIVKNYQKTKEIN